VAVPLPILAPVDSNSSHRPALTTSPPAPAGGAREHAGTTPPRDVRG
jgi:hypothetical protein